MKPNGLAIMLAVAWLAGCSGRPDRAVVTDLYARSDVTITNTAVVDDMYKTFARTPNQTRSRIELKWPYCIKFYANNTLVGTTWFTPDGGTYRTDLVKQNGDDILEAEANNKMKERIQKWFNK